MPDARLHLTLHFIGSFPHDGIEALADRLAAVAPRRMMLRADRPEVWRGGLAVLRIAPEAGVRGLHEDLGAVLSELAVPLDTRPFTPHVTLARKAAGARPPDSAPELDWSADGFALVDSITGANAAYRVVRSFPTER